jgi:hypothetical protein
MGIGIDCSRDIPDSEEIKMKGAEPNCRRHGGRWFAGLLLIAIGTIFLLKSLGVIQLTVWQIFRTYWPVLLILLGISIIMRRSR